MTKTNDTMCDVFTKQDKQNGWYVFLLTLQVVILFANILLNGTLCYLLKKLKKSAYRPCHTLIWHQVFVNFLVAGFCQLTVVLKLLPWCFHCWVILSQFSTVSFNVLRGVSAWSISLLSIDRYRSIVHFSTYKERTVCSCITVSIVLIWIPSVVMGFSPLTISYANDSICNDTCLYSQSICSSIGHNVYNVLYVIIFFVLPTAVMIKTYYSVFSSARKHGIRRLDTRNAGQVGADRTRGIPHSRLLTEVKATRVLLMALTAYMVCFTPYFVSITLSISEFWTENEPPIVFLVFCHILLFSHTLFDPVLYGFGDRHVKKLCLEIFWKKRQPDRVARFPFGVSAESISMISMTSGITVEPTSPEKCISLVSREDLVSRDFLEIYRIRKSSESMDRKVRPQRFSWISARVKPVVAWVDPSVSNPVISRKISKPSMKTMALRTFGEAAAALAIPQFTTTVTTERTTTRLHSVTSRISIYSENNLTKVD